MDFASFINNQIVIFTHTNIWLLLFIAGVQFVLLLISIYNAITIPLLKKVKLKLNIYPKVSVLIPARNEEANIKRCLESILLQAYPDFEVLVLDDNSTDSTASIIKDIDAGSHRVRYIKGEELPLGWLGKNWACKQLADKSEGEILIYTDADNFYKKEAIFKTVALMQNTNKDLISVFPEQTMHTLSEKMIIPLIDLLLYSLLPIKQVSTTKSEYIAAANGQWIAIRKSAYDKIGGHTAVKNHLVEDVKLMKNAKKQNLNVEVLYGTELIFGRMYASIKEIFNGFSKNVFGLASLGAIPLIIITIILGFVTFYPYYLLFTDLFYFGLMIILLSVILRVVLSLRFKHNILVSVLLHPVAVIFFILVSCRYILFQKSIKWKGRSIA